MITSHVRPDPDAIGSVLALREAVFQSGGTPTCIMEDSCPRRCLSLAGADDIVTADSAGEQAPFDVAIIVDCGNQERIGDVLRFLSTSARIANIDHHISNTRFGDVVLLDTDASASGEVLHGIFHNLGVKLTPTIAASLLAGILTDTGRFRHTNTTPEALRVSAKLVEAGASLSELTEQLYFTIPSADVRAMAKILGTLELFESGRIATMHVDGQHTVEDPDHLVDLCRAIENVEVAVLFSEMRDGRIRVSMRSKTNVNVSEIASSFGGGGHERAAGFRMFGTIQSVQQRLLPVLRSALEKLPDDLQS
ncbi:MAG: bifunctional oligoribonuclease/PAP phosphatase NrnA [Calditrichaeota bacterium]|nr:bifunctional oligoribonuclease/PAP phosphatase NrnA [Calditrichota bacterium]MCB9366525.1 bifunctional oligoribonuclease/PAP phosphatase NrnA [Calditrichota bacterium]MCB9391217.1 bifunctional oligoribonuclease/PAP phosphatase NrnA [Calditrichota bacterium]